MLAHELSHVKNRDTLTMTITATIAGAVSMLANFAFFFGGDGATIRSGFVGVLLVTLLAPIAAMLVQMAISRTREFEADRAGAEISGRPLWLASALAADRPTPRGIDNPQADSQSRDRAYVHHQSAAWRRSVGIVLQPSLDGGAHRAAARDGGRSQAQNPPGPWA